MNLLTCETPFTGGCCTLDTVLKKIITFRKKREPLKKDYILLTTNDNNKKELNKLLIDIKVEIHGIAYDLIHLDNLKWATRRSAVCSQESRVFFSLSFSFFFYFLLSLFCVSPKLLFFPYLLLECSQIRHWSSDDVLSSSEWELKC